MNCNLIMHGHHQFIGIGDGIGGQAIAVLDLSHRTL
jgi:hypothetical protein